MNRLFRKTILVLITVSMVLSSLPVYATENNAEYYVDDSVSSGGDGTVDRPFNNINAALSAVKNSKNSSAVIILREGRYFLKNTLDIVNKNENISLTIKGYDGECAEIFGGIEVNYSAAKPVDNRDIYRRLKPSARDKIVAIDLTGYKIDDYGAIYETGSSSSGAQLYYDDKPLTIARFPNFGYDNVKSISSADGVTTIGYEDVFNENWRKEETAFMTYYSLAGYNAYTTNVTFDLAEPKVNVLTSTKLEKEGRFYLWNMLSEIDVPGEYYIDKENDILYVYPPFDNMKGTLVLSTLTKNFVDISYANNITLENLIFKAGGANGIIINNSNNILIKDCVIKNITTSGISMTDSDNVKVEGCDISNMGQVGIIIRGGGDYTDFTPSGIEIVNNDIYNGSIYSKANGACISIITGTKCVQPRVYNNRLHDMPCFGIQYSGALEPYYGYNEIYNVCREVLDNGATYAGRTAALRNTVFESNFFHHINKYEGAAGSHVYCIYADDNLNDVESVNNIFYECEYPFLIGGGSDNTIKNNLMIDCTNSILFDDRGLNWSAWCLMANINASLAPVPWKNPVWSERYPEIGWMYDDTKLPIGYPQRNLITNNMILNSGKESIVKTVYENGTVENNQHFKDGYSFADAENFNFALTEDSKTLKEMPEFENIDMSRIGLTREVEAGEFSLLFPENNQHNIEAANAEFLWEKSEGSDAYHLMVALDENFDSVVVDEILLNNCYKTDKLRYNATKYYWKVETVKMSKNDKVIPSKSGVYSFTTKKEEKRDTEELEELVASLDTKYGSIEEGTEAGQYPEGSKDKIAKAVEEAKTVIRDMTIKQNQVKKMYRVLNQTQEDVNHGMQYNVTDFSEILKDKDNWALADGDAVIDDDGFKSVKAGNFGYLGKKLPATDIYKFKVKFQLTNFQGFGLNYDDPTVSCWKSKGYCILIKRDIIELQRYTTGAYGIIATFVNEDKILSDTWYDMEIGKINTYNGCRIIMKVDGKTIIDYIDASEYARKDEGYFAVYDSSQGGLQIK